MSELETYVATKNQWNAIFGGTDLDIANANDRQEIASMLDCDLSPENISCDGERSQTDVRKRYRVLKKAASELMQLDATVNIYEIG